MVSDTVEGASEKEFQGVSMPGLRLLKPASFNTAGQPPY